MVSKQSGNRSFDCCQTVACVNIYRSATICKHYTGYIIAFNRYIFRRITIIYVHRKACIIPSIPTSYKRGCMAACGNICILNTQIIDINIYACPLQRSFRNKPRIYAARTVKTVDDMPVTIYCSVKIIDACGNIFTAPGIPLSDCIPIFNCTILPIDFCYIVKIDVIFKSVIFRR